MNRFFSFRVRNTFFFAFCRQRERWERERKGTDRNELLLMVRCWHTPFELMVNVNDGDRLRVVARSLHHVYRYILKMCQAAKPPKGIIKMWAKYIPTHTRHSHHLQINMHTKRWCLSSQVCRSCALSIASTSSTSASECQQFYNFTIELLVTAIEWYGVKWKWLGVRTPLAANASVKMPLQIINKEK